MTKVSLIKIRSSDKRYFSKWWRDEDLLKVTSGVLRRITDREVDAYFARIFKDKKNKQYMIKVNRKVIGHISLEQRKNAWYETRVIIGEKKLQGKGYGTQAIKLLINKAKRLDISKIYLEVRANNIKAIRAYEKCDFRKAGIKKYPENKYLPQTLKMVLRRRQ